MASLGLSTLKRFHETLPEPGTRAAGTLMHSGAMSAIRACSRMTSWMAARVTAFCVPAMTRRRSESRSALGELRLFDHGHLFAKLSHFCTREFVPVLSIVKTRAVLSNLLRQRLTILVAHAHRVPDDGAEGIGLLLHLFFDNLND